MSNGERLRETQDVISFTGYSEGISNEEGAANCVEGFKEIVG